MIEVRVQAEPFAAGTEIARLSALGGGGVTTFIGVVRGEDGLTELTLEHHPTMTAAMLGKLAEEATGRWDLIGTTIIHRYGDLRPGDEIVFVGTAARHRHAALDACAALIDRLKTDATFWKRERFADGSSHWVEPRAGDAAAAARWLRSEA